MKHLNIFCSFMLVFLAIGSPGEAMAQMAVEDKNNRRQVERMVFMHWKKFKPAWYFWLLHGKYKKKDRRIILQLAPALAALAGNRKESGQEKEDIAAIHGYRVAQQANTVAESHYHLHYKKVFKQLDSDYNRLYSLCIKNKVAGGDLSRFEGERTMLDEYLQAVREGNINKGESAEAMTVIQEDYEKLLAAMRGTLNAYRLKNRISLIKINP